MLLSFSKINFYCKTAKHNSGFTLIEVMVYLALFAIMFGGAVATAYNVVESSGRNHARAVLQEEGDFIIAKINWDLAGAQVVVTPNPGTPGSVLSVNKFDGTSTAINFSGDYIQVENSSGTYPLNNSNVQLAANSLIFKHTSSVGDGVNPEKVDAAFTLNSLTPGGALMSQDFFTTVYLRK